MSTTGKGRFARASQPQKKAFRHEKSFDKITRGAGRREKLLFFMLFLREQIPRRPGGKRKKTSTSWLYCNYQVAPLNFTLVASSFAEKKRLEASVEVGKGKATPISTKPP
jgi:hypothetical protein